MESKVTVAVVQDGSVPFDAAASAEKTCRLIAEAAHKGAKLVLFPGAFLGTYPKGLTFDAPVGRRLPEGREDFLRYYNGAVETGGPGLRDIEKAARGRISGPACLQDCKGIRQKSPFFRKLVKSDLAPQNRFLLNSLGS